MIVTVPTVVLVRSLSSKSKTKFSPNLSFMLFEKRKNYITPNLSVHIISLERMIG